jgi:hypothetical protein
MARFQLNIGMTEITNMEFSNKCTKCNRIIKQGVASYSFHAFGRELCWDDQNQERLELKAKLLTNSNRKIDFSGVRPVLPSR